MKPITLAEAEYMAFRLSERIVQDVKVRGTDSTVFQSLPRSA